VKLLVTGAGGFLGAAVVRAALGRGLQVIGFARQPAPERLRALAREVPVIPVAMSDHEAVARAIDVERPDVVVHTAWSGLTASGRASNAQLEDNVLPSCRLIDAAAQAGVRKFIGIGSQAEYGPLNRRVAETDVPQPNSLYGAAKLSTCYLGSAMARQAGMEFAWMRLFAAYGPGDNPNWLIPSLIIRMSAGERPRLTAGTQKWDYLFIDDAAEAILAIASREGAEGIFNLGSGQPAPVRQVVEMIRDRVAPGLKLVFGEVPFGPDQIMHMEANIDRLRQVADWTPAIDLQQGLTRTIEALR